MGLEREQDDDIGVSERSEVAVTPEDLVNPPLLTKSSWHVRRPLSHFNERPSRRTRGFRESRRKRYDLFRDLELDWEKNPLEDDEG